MTVEDLWDSLMTVDDFIELLSQQPKEPFPTEHIEELNIRSNAVKWGFCSK